ncbi:hypothetical protein C1Y31_27800 [Pseudomonas sp. FW305-25]|nr:hypothetical protein C1Y31_27800 [Pseudomonas sp. FW305-25]PMY63411.1 hypothetical protein C1Y32_26755 [Pseudomonas sp. FW126-L8]PNA73796.1 hypothetical protein C1Y33_26255 [Pseudomonas sp. FW305-76]
MLGFAPQAREGVRDGVSDQSLTRDGVRPDTPRRLDRRQAWLLQKQVSRGQRGPPPPGPPPKPPCGPPPPPPCPPPPPPGGKNIQQPDRDDNKAITTATFATRLNIIASLSFRTRTTSFSSFQTAFVRHRAPHEGKEWVRVVSKNPQVSRDLRAHFSNSEWQPRSPWPGRR